MALIQPKDGTFRDSLAHAIAADGNVRCMAAVTTNLVAEAAARHKTTHTVTAALGRTLTGTLLLAAGVKELDRLTVQIDCNGPIGGITAEANGRGQVRGYVRNPCADAPLNAQGKFDVRAIIGEGTLYVTYESGFEIGLYREPYRGSVPLISGEIAEDFAYYLSKSEQIPSAVMLGVLVRARANGDHFIEAAGGIMIQIMPGADEQTVRALEESVKRTPQTTTLIRRGARPADLLQTALGDLRFELLEEQEVEFACTCSHERALALISAMSLAEIRSMLEEDRGAVMTCHFCNTTYHVQERELAEILQRAEKEG